MAAVKEGAKKRVVLATRCSLLTPDYPMLVDPLCFAKRVKKYKSSLTLFPRSEERVVARSNDRVSKIAK
jgi:hypothetical protein